MPFTRTPENYVVEVPDEEHLGPAMKRLNERQRRFVCALSAYGGEMTKAYVFAGYDVSTPGAARACASRLHSSDLIKEAIREEAWRRLDYSSLVAVSAMIELAGPNNPDKATRLKAADMLSKRNGFHEKTEHLVVHEDRRTTKEILDAIDGVARRLGLDPAQLLGHKRETAQLPAPIDAEYEEVPAGADGIEDLL